MQHFGEIKESFINLSEDQRSITLEEERNMRRRSQKGFEFGDTLQSRVRVMLTLI